MVMAISAHFLREQATMIPDLVSPGRLAAIPVCTMLMLMALVPAHIFRLHFCLFAGTSQTHPVVLVNMRHL
jgi:hypothetical protein